MFTAAFMAPFFNSMRRVILWHIPHHYYSRWGLYPQAIFITIALVWFELHPDWATQGPGVAMAFLAVAAIWMGLRGSHSTRTEGAVWIAISLALFWGEMHFIRADREAHDAEQAVLRSREETARQEQADSFQKVIEDGKRLFKSLAEEKAVTTESLERITGGDEYCWVSPAPSLSVSLGGDPAHQGGNWWQLVLRNSGKVPLPTCDIRFVSFPLLGQAGQSEILSYHFEKVPSADRGHQREPYYIEGNRRYSGVIETPTHQFVEFITFEHDPKDPTRSIPKCTVTPPGEQVLLEGLCDPTPAHKWVRRRLQPGERRW